MDKYTYKDVIIDPSSEEAKNAIGKEAYYSDNPTECLEYANNDDKYHLERFNSIENYNCPFNFGDFNYSCLIVKKEEPYEERATKWIKENGLKKGDYVKVTRKAEDFEDGWGTMWNSSMDDSVDKVLQVKDCDCPGCGIQLEDYKHYPYFVLEKVEPEPRYVPFESPQEFISAYNKASKEVMPDTESMLSNSSMWLKWQDAYVGITYISRHGVNYGAEFLDWDELLDEYTFLNGSPCGKEIKEWVTTN